MDLTNVLPFLAALKKTSPGQADNSGADPGTDPDLEADANPPATPAPASSPAQPGPIAQDLSTLPNMAIPDVNPVTPDKGTWWRQPYESKGHALLNLLRAGVMGGLQGEAQEAQNYAATGRTGGFGAGFYGAENMPIELGLKGQQLTRWGIENAIANNQLLSLPFLTALQYQKGAADLAHTQAETSNTQAKTGQTQAETAAVPTKTALEQAQIGEAGAKAEESRAQAAKLQAELEYYQKQGLAPGVPLDLQEAQDWLKKNPGKGLADYMAYKAKLVPQFNFNLQNAGAGAGPGGAPSAIAQALAANQMKWQDAVSPRTPMSVKSALLREVKQVNPNYNSAVRAEGAPELPEFVPKENMAPEDYEFQDANTEDILAAAIGQRRPKGLATVLDALTKK